MTIRLFGETSTRVVDVAPSSYDSTSHTVDCVISMGSPVKRIYGTEVLRIHESAVDTNRVWSGSCPVLDSHQQGSIAHALGRVTATWFRGNAFMGRLTFNQTAEGSKAEGMVSRGEIAGISAGYRVEEWEVTDAEGHVVNPDSMRWDDDLTFTATRWELLETSLVTVPADAGAGIRSYPEDGFDRALVIADLSESVQVILLARMRIATRQRMYDAQQVLFG
jgi:hypothetical protein